MLDIFDTYATDPALETAGAWFPLNGDAEVLVARAGNPKYLRALRTALEQNKSVLERDDAASEETAERITVGVMADTILLGWKNLGFKGVQLEYTPENAKTMLRVKDFRKRVTELSETFSAYKAGQETATGNV
jgi:hypothetical protein